MSHQVSHIVSHLVSQMTTEKKRVQGYLSNEVYLALSQYALDHQISQSTALEQILSSVLLGESLSKLPVDSLGELKSELVKEVFDQAEIYIDHRLDLITARLRKLEQQLNQQSELLNNSLTELPNELPAESLAESLNESPAESPNNTLESFSNVQLSRLLGKNDSTLSRWATGKRKPPENFEYVYDSKTKRWFKK